MRNLIQHIRVCKKIGWNLDFLLIKILLLFKSSFERSNFEAVSIVSHNSSDLCNEKLLFKTEPRGIHPQKKGAIVKNLVPLMPSNRRNTWLSMPENKKSSDMISSRFWVKFPPWLHFPHLRNPSFILLITITIVTNALIHSIYSGKPAIQNWCSLYVQCAYRLQRLYMFARRDDNDTFTSFSAEFLCLHENDGMFCRNMSDLFLIDLFILLLLIKIFDFESCQCRLRPIILIMIHGFFDN